MDEKELIEEGQRLKQEELELEKAKIKNRFIIGMTAVLAPLALLALGGLGYGISTIPANWGFAMWISGIVATVITSIMTICAAAQCVDACGEFWERVRAMAIRRAALIPIFAFIAAVGYSLTQ